jgi:putative peptidoglycan lipid II flippase
MRPLTSVRKPPASRATRVSRGAFSTASMTLVSNVTGFLRQLAFAWVYGAGPSMDAFLVASVLSQMVFASVNAALQSTLIPVYALVRQASEEEAERFVGAVSSLVAVLTTLLGFAAYLLSPLLVHLLAPGFGAAEARFTTSLLRVMMPSLVFMGLSSILAGFLQAHNRFGEPAALGVPRNLVLIVGAAWLGRHFGIAVLAYGSVLGAILQLIVLWVPLRHMGKRLRVVWRPWHPGIREMARRLPGVFVNLFMYQAALVVDRILASGLPAGMISALNYAQLLMSFPVGLLTSLAVAAFPTFSELAAAEAGADLSRVVATSLRLLAFLVVPVAVYTAFVRVPLVAIVYAHGAYGARALADTADALLFFAPSMVSTCLNSLIGRAVFATGETRVLFTSAAWAMGVTIVADLILVHPLQQGGLALGTSLGSWASTIVLLRFLGRRLERFPWKALVGNTFALAAAAGVSFGVAYVGLTHLGLPVPTHGLVRLAEFLLANFALGLALYLALERALGLDQGIREPLRTGLRSLLRAAV